MNDPVKNATATQRLAARPDRSVALRASAGSGKTKVLVDRFIRLCVEDGAGLTHPRSILAVTFTRKAAVEIQERLLDRAAKMVLAGSAELRAMLGDLFSDRSDPQPSDQEMQRAAGLYEMVLEDLSGLHVGTIHSFCQLILGRFAAEAGLDPHFTVIENQDDLVDEALDQLEKEIAGDEQLAEVARGVGANPTAVRKAVKLVFGEQMRVERWLSRHETDPGVAADRQRLTLLPALLADIRAFLFPELDPAREPDAESFAPLLTSALRELATSGWDGVDLAMGADASRTEKTTAKLRAGCEAALALTGQEQLEAARDLLLTKKGEARKHSRVKDAEIKDAYNALVAETAVPVLRILHTVGHVELYHRNRDLLHLGLRALDIYSALKRRDRVVDFQDLEDMARRLMGDQAQALSLLYRLDDSIHHILLDEFQDTNFNQWDMLRPFVDEFISGGAGDRARTLFFVGDMKQSIYGFRGAEPAIFLHARNLLTARDPEAELDLPTNFRSLGAVVGGVGCLFNASPLGDAFSPDERVSVQQDWARREPSGTVVVLEPFAAAGQEDDDGRSGDQLAADAATRLVQHLKDSGATTTEGFGENETVRPLRWSDFLVLTRSRTEISLYEKAFRQAGIPIVPPGRGMLAASREVQDILALLRWLTWPEDDVALTTVLRSPIFRIGQQEFQELLARRDLLKVRDDGRFAPPKGLWRVLGKAADDQVFGPVAETLKTWRKHLGFENCHDLLRRIFREGLVLEKYQQALGDQARYNLMRLFDLALGSEMTGTPTARRLADHIARAASQGGQEEGTLPGGDDEGRVRFMTIHGAKGLEAPVVLLVDADRDSGQESLQVRTDPAATDTPLLFKVTKNYRTGFVLPESVAWPADALQVAGAAAAARDVTEEANLLYVAMTRARDRLYVLGGDRLKGTAHDSPLRRIQRSAAAGGCEKVVLDDPDWLERPPAHPETGVGSDPGLDEAAPDAYRAWEPPVLKERVKIITPSSAEGDPPARPVERAHPSPGVKAAGPDHRVSGVERGNRIHQLLQVAAETGAMPPGTGDIHAEAAAVFGNPALDWVFRPDGGRGLCEVPVIHRRATVQGAPEERITGSIDRLVLRPGRADVIDYKSNRLSDDITYRNELCEHYRPQLEAYREVVAALYPDREVHTWLLFTDPAAASDPLSEIS